jgi:hypothetical protein
VISLKRALLLARASRSGQAALSPAEAWRVPAADWAMPGYRKRHLMSLRTAMPLTNKCGSDCKSICRDAQINESGVLTAPEGSIVKPCTSIIRRCGSKTCACPPE